MNKRIIIVLVLSLVSLSCQQSSNEEFQNCLKKEAYSVTTKFVLDLYYNKMSLSNFVDSYLSTSINNFAGVVQCFQKTDNLNIFSSNTGILTKLGLTLLYGSNCEKDLGPTLILLDTVLGNLKNIKTEYKELIINGLFTGLIGYQSFNDCKDSINAIKQVWSESRK
jgi:hypothetical protein